MNLFDYHDYESFRQFRLELQYVFEFLRYSSEKDQMKEKLAEHKAQYDELSSQAKVLLTKLTNIKGISGVKPEKFAKGKFSMCKAFEDIKEEGIIEGEKRGMEKGIRKGEKRTGKRHPTSSPPCKAIKCFQRAGDKRSYRKVSAQ